MKTYSVDTYSIVRTELIINVVLMFTATLCVGLRIYARKTRKIALWWDDWCILACIFLVYITLGFQVAYAKLGMRTHIQDLPMENLVVMLKVLVAYQLIYGTAILLAKFSYLFFYLRIFVNRGFVQSTYVVMGVVVLWWIANVLQVFLICTPFDSNWNVTVKAKCGDRPVAYEIIGAINMITDVAIWALPIPTVRKLQLPSSSKIGVCAIFAIGVVICVISIIRMKSLSTLNFADFSFTMIAPVFWTVTEPSLAIINACLPILRHLLNWVFPTIFKSTRSKNASTGNSRGKVFEAGSFQRMHDGEYPLTALKDGDTTIKISVSKRHGPDSFAEESIGDDHTHHSADSIEEGIHVKKQWTVT